MLDSTLTIERADALIGELADGPLAESNAKKQVRRFRREPTAANANMALNAIARLPKARRAVVALILKQ